MKTLLLNLFLVLSTVQLSAQQLTEDDFLGSWKAVDVRLIPEMIVGFDEDGKKKIEQVKDGFVDAVFSFKSNGDFTIEFSDRIPEFMKELEFLNNKKWKIVDGETVGVGTEEDGYSHMRIIVRSEQDQKFFALFETPFIMKVVEQ